MPIIKITILFLSLSYSESYSNHGNSIETEEETKSHKSCLDIKLYVNPH